jgi:hypothetical protein
MKTRMLALAISALLLSPVHSEEPVSINALAEKPAEFSGRQITVTGLVDRISVARRMVVLIDASEATCTDACDRKTLVVRVPEDTALPGKGDLLTVTGTLVPDSDPLQMDMVRKPEGNP